MGFCTRCGQELKDGEAYCGNCGNKVGKESQSEIDDLKTELLAEDDNNEYMVNDEDSFERYDKNQLNNGKYKFNISKISKKTKIIFIIALAICVALSGFVITSYTKAEKAKEQLNLGNKYLEEGNYEEAILALNKVIEVDTKNTDARIQLGKAYVITGETDKAEKVLQEAINIDSKKVPAYSELTNTYISNGKIKEAKEILENGYKKTSNENLKKLLDEINQKMKVGAMKIGEYIQLGSYLGNSLVWRVVNVDSDGTPLLWLDKILCYKSFDAAESGKYGQEGGTLSSDKNRQKYGSSRWANSNLREWLNSSESKVNYTTQPPSKDAVAENPYEDEAGFLTNFIKSEQNAIKEAEIKTGLSEMDNGLSNVKDDGKEFKSEVVKDKVFILSYEEWSKFILGEIYKDEGMNFLNQMESPNGLKSDTKYAEYRGFDFWLRNAQFNGLKALQGQKQLDPYGYSSSSIHTVINKFIYCGLADGKPFGAVAAGYNHGADKTNNGDIGVCPAVYLKPETIIWSGKGTNSEPYMVNKIQDSMKEVYDKMADDIDAAVKNYDNLQEISFSKMDNNYMGNYKVAKKDGNLCYIHYQKGDFDDNIFYYKNEKVIKVRGFTLKGDSYEYYFKNDNLILIKHYDGSNKLVSKDYAAVNKLNSETKADLLNLGGEVLNNVKNYKGIESEKGKT